MFNFIRKTPRDYDAVIRDALKARTLNTKARNFTENRLSVPLTKLSSYESYMTAGTKNVWATFRACHIKAAFVTSTVFNLVDKNRNVNGEAANKDLFALLTTPNPHDSWEELLYLWAFHIFFTGNAYWLKDEVNGRGQPLYVYPLLPQFMTIVPDAKNKIGHYEYKVNGVIQKFLPEEIIHFKRVHPNDTLFGIGDIEPMSDLLKDYINRNTLQEKFIGNGASPSGIMSRDDGEEIDPTQWAKFKAQWNKDYGGQANAGKTAFMSGKWTYQKLGLTHQEMQSIERDKFTIEQIFTAHGVPHSLAGIQGAANYATARQDEINFRKYEIVPLLDMLVGKLNSGKALIRNYSETLRLTYEMSGLIDVKQVWDDYGQLFINGGMTANELRVKMGLTEDETNPMLDQYLLTSNRIPIEMAGLATLPPDPSSQDPTA